MSPTTSDHLARPTATNHHHTCRSGTRPLRTGWTPTRASLAHDALLLQPTLKDSAAAVAKHPLPKQERLQLRHIYSSQACSLRTLQLQRSRVEAVAVLLRVQVADLNHLQRRRVLDHTRAVLGEGEASEAKLLQFGAVRQGEVAVRSLEGDGTDDHAQQLGHADQLQLPHVSKTARSDFDPFQSLTLREVQRRDRAVIAAPVVHDDLRDGRCQFHQAVAVADVAADGGGEENGVVLEGSRIYASLSRQASFSSS